MKQVVIGIYGNALDVSADGRAAPPQALKDLLEPELTYKQLVRLIGHRSYDSYGHRQHVRAEKKVLFAYDGLGRLVTKAGFLTRLREKLEGADYRVTVVDRTPPHPRPDRFDADWDEVFRRFDLRHGQDKLLTAVVANDRGIIEAPPAYGKSHSFIYVPFLYPNANVLVVCTRKDVVQSLVSHLTKYVPNVGQVGAGKRTAGRVTVCTAQSLKHIVFDDVDVVLADEAHELAASGYASNLGRFNWAHMYGFSGSPWGRRDGTGVRLEAIFGGNIFTMTYQEALDLKLVVPIHVEWLNVQTASNPATGYVDTARMRHGLWRNEHRNAIIAEKARKYGPDEQVLIMCTTFEHAVYLRQHLPDYTLCHAERADDDALFARFVRDGMLPADEPPMTDRRRITLRTRFEEGKLKKVIATDVWSTGVNFVGLSVLIRADARSSSIMDTQIPGRVCRLHDATKPFGVVVDCLDQFDDGFKEAARKRRRNYAAKGWQQFVPAGASL